jgi:hypothetical protein
MVSTFFFSECGSKILAQALLQSGYETQTFFSIAVSRLRNQMASANPTTLADFLRGSSAAVPVAEVIR